MGLRSTGKDRHALRDICPCACTQALDWQARPYHPGGPMTRRKKSRAPKPDVRALGGGVRMSAFADALCDMFPQNWVNETAQASGFIKRERKIKPFAFLWVMVLSYGVRLQQTLAGLKRNYERTFGMTLSDGSWHDRFTPELVEFLRQCVVHAIEHLSQVTTRNLDGRLSEFKDVLIQDSTVIRLHEKLSDIWPAARTKKVAAGVKVSTLVSAVSNGPNRVEIHGERTSEVKTLKLGPWIKDRILLIDLGFYKHQVLARIMENGGHFVTRMKNKVDPLIVTSNIVHRGRSIDIAGKKLSEIAERLDRKVLDCQVEIRFKRRKYKGKSRHDTMTVRLVGLLNDETGEYHFYLTDIGADVLNAKEIGALYRCRWEVELVFKELKSKYALDQVKTSNEDAVLGLIWVAILTLLVSRRLYHEMRRFVPPDVNPARFTQLRWANTFMENAPFILICILMRTYDNWNVERNMELLMAVFASQALDPHVDRDRPREGWWT